MSSEFYTNAAALDALKKAETPTKEQVQQCVSLVSQPSLLRYFFVGLNNANWLPPLAEAGVFDRPPEPEETGAGYYRVAGWEATRYLVRVADRHPQIVALIALTIRTENFRVHSDLVEAALHVSPRYAAIIEPAVVNWLESRLPSRLPEEVADLMVYLAKGEEREAALDLLAALASPAAEHLGQPLKAGKPRVYSETRSIIDELQLSKIVRGPMKEVAAIWPERVVAIMEARLVTAIHRDAYQSNTPDPTLYSFWAEHAEVDGVVQPVQGYKALLLRGLREAAEQAPASVVSRAVRRYMDHPYAVLRRLAIGLVAQQLERLRNDLAEEVLGRSKVLCDTAIWPEICSLLEAAFDRLSPDLRARLIDRITAGPPPDLLERERRRQQEREPELSPEEAIQRWSDGWILDHLWPLRNHALPDHAQDLLASLRATYGEQQSPYRGGIRTSIGEPESPKTKAELNEMSPTDVTEYLRRYTPEVGEWPFRSSRHPLGRALQEAVSEEPQRYAEIAPFFAAPPMRPIYALYLLRGLEKAWEARRDFDWSPVLSLISDVVQREAAPAQELDEYSEEEPDWPDVSRDVASLLEEAVRSDDHTVPEEHIAVIRDVLLRLVRQVDPALDDPSGSTFDPATRAVNSVRGRALEALILYALWRARTRDQQPPGPYQEPMGTRLEPAVRQALTERLDKGKEPSEAVHSLYGKFLPQLRYLDEDWFVTHLPRILPEDLAQEAYWRAAWSSYVAFNGLYLDLYRLLLPHYRRALESLTGQEGRTAGLESLADRLAGHVLAAYWAGEESLSEDGLVATLYRLAPSSVRGNATRMLGRWLKDDEKAVRDGVWPRLKALWKAREVEADRGASPEQYQDELSAYIGWLKHVPADLGQLYPLIERTLPYLRTGAYGDLLLDYLHDQAAAYPKRAVQILLQMLVQGVEPLRYGQDEVTAVLTAAMTSGDVDARADAVETINLFGERGEYAYRDLLNL